MRVCMLVIVVFILSVAALTAERAMLPGPSALLALAVAEEPPTPSEPLPSFLEHWPQDEGYPDPHNAPRWLGPPMPDGLDVKARDPAGGTLLTYALNLGLEEKAREVLDLGADPNLADQFGVTPLQIAVGQQSEPMVRLLLQHGAKADVLDRFGKSPLYWATYLRQDSIARLLQEAGAVADPNHPLPRPDQRNLDANLVLSAQAGDEAAVRRLIAEGADPNAWVRQGEFSDYCFMPLVEAIRSGHTEVARLLLDSGASPDATEGWWPFRHEGETALKRAAGDLALIDMLLAHGADVNLEALGGGSVMAAAIIRLDLAMVGKLRDRGARITGPAVERAMTRIVLWEEGDEKEVADVLGYLLDAGASPDARWTDITVLMSACGRPTEGGSVVWPRVADLLLRRGADPNWRDDGGRTALWIAARYATLPVVQLLVEHGANVNAVDSDGESVLDGAHTPAIRRFLVKHGAKAGKELSAPGR